MVLARDYCWMRKDLNHRPTYEEETFDFASHMTHVNSYYVLSLRCIIAN
jgi:hypothetical protein